MPRGVSSPWQYAMMPVQSTNTPFMFAAQRASPAPAGGYLPQNYNQFSPSPAHHAVDPALNGGEDHLMMMDDTMFQNAYQSPSYTDATMTGFEDSFTPLFDGTPNSDVPAMSLEDPTFPPFGNTEFAEFVDSEVFGTGMSTMGDDMLDCGNVDQDAADEGFMCGNANQDAADEAFMGNEWFNGVWN
jgi:hypothetical protein